MGLLVLMVAHQISKVSAPKYVLGLKIREPLFQKRTFLYIGQWKSAPEPTRSVPENVKTRSEVVQIGARTPIVGARFFSKQKDFSWLPNSAPEYSNSGPDFCRG